MSGGAFDYAYFDAEELAATVEEMADFAEEDDAPDEVVERLHSLESALEENLELMQMVEWIASGDYGSEKYSEVVE